MKKAIIALLLALTAGCGGFTCTQPLQASRAPTEDGKRVTYTFKCPNTDDKLEITVPPEPCLEGCWPQSAPEGGEK